MVKSPLEIPVAMMGSIGFLGGMFVQSWECMRVVVEAVGSPGSGMTPDVPQETRNNKIEHQLGG